MTATNLFETQAILKAAAEHGLGAEELQAEVESLKAYADRPNHDALRIIYDEFLRDDFEKLCGVAAETIKARREMEAHK